jgi:hypothetical protein
MAVRKHLVIIGLWVASVLATGFWVHAQTPLPPRERRPAPSQAEPTPTVITGNDLGFRIESRKGGTPVGRFVVRINGQWVDVEESVGVKRLTIR